jgi:multidrug resistance protein MdtO
MIGILIGVAVSLAVSAAMWPEREGQALKTMLGRLLRNIAQLARAGADLKDPATQSAEIDRTRLQGWSLLMQNREMQARVALEPGWEHDHDSVTAQVTTWLAQAQETLFAVTRLQIILQHAVLDLQHPFVDAFEVFRERAAKRLEWVADRLVGERSVEQTFQLADAMATLNRCREASPNAPAWIDEVLSAAQTLSQRITQLEGSISRADL